MAKIQNYYLSDGSKFLLLSHVHFKTQIVGPVTPPWCTHYLKTNIMICKLYYNSVTTLNKMSKLINSLIDIFKKLENLFFNTLIYLNEILILFIVTTANGRI